MSESKKTVLMPSNWRCLATIVMAFSLAAGGQQALKLSGDLPVTDDPSIARDGSTCYVFATTSTTLGGTQILSPDSRWIGPGGETDLARPEGDLRVFHACDTATGKPALQISTIAWAGDWPHAALDGSSK